jgi:hypothetical protein
MLSPDAEWITGGHIDRSGLASFLHIIRDPDDPERSSREERRARLGDLATTEWKKLRHKDSAPMWREAMLKLLSDGQPRTFNAMAVIIADITADVASDGAAEGVLWSLVAEELLEHTVEAPVFFRLREVAP